MFAIFVVGIWKEECKWRTRLMRLRIFFLLRCHINKETSHPIKGARDK